MRKQLSIFVVAALTLVFSGSAVALPPPNGASTFSVSKKTQIPGDTLMPGTYSIQILDSLSDRMILRIESTSGKEHIVFLGVPGKAITGANTSGAVMWKSDLKGVPALRGFAFPSGYTVEFVYPKAEAAELAKANTDRVVAIDPQSEGRPVMHKMSAEDMQMINLWMLSLTTAGPNDKTPAILAQKYQDRPAQRIDTASATPVRVTPAGASQSQVAELSAPQNPSAQASRFPAPRRHPAIAALPHTGSFLPLIALGGIFSLFAVGAIRLWVFVHPLSAA